ncbi:hypothetical protein LRS73_35445 (plasmid) [Methylobacterium currus]|uniref:hypothetical protein n=1 Tax=Methylobacterium currus TaxID=2051553 RepID=UPI001E4E4E94|nr:hypothetical protein [Methylobacterium currus]UHC20474.1 hypothetical protein LRS73_35445 [Methylobacterium currus]
MSFRISSDLHEKLIASATEGERSLSEEIEWRLEQSFREPEIATKIAETAIVSVKESVMESVYADCGSSIGYEFGRQFGRAITDKLEKVRNYFPDAPEPWYRDIIQINFLIKDLDGVDKSITEYIAAQKARQHPSDSNVFILYLAHAQSLGIDTSGLNQEEVIIKVGEYYAKKEKSQNSE